MRRLHLYIYVKVSPWSLSGAGAGLMTSPSCKIPHLSHTRSLQVPAASSMVTKATAFEDNQNTRNELLPKLYQSGAILQLVK